MSMPGDNEMNIGTEEVVNKKADDNSKTSQPNDINTDTLSNPEIPAEANENITVDPIELFNLDEDTDGSAQDGSPKLFISKEELDDMHSEFEENEALDALIKNEAEKNITIPEDDTKKKKSKNKDLNQPDNKDDKKKNIFSRAFDWVKEKAKKVFENIKSAVQLVGIRILGGKDKFNEGIKYTDVDGVLNDPQNTITKLAKNENTKDDKSVDTKDDKPVDKSDLDTDKNKPVNTPPTKPKELNVIIKDDDLKKGYETNLKTFKDRKDNSEKANIVTQSRDEKATLKVPVGSKDIKETDLNTYKLSNETFAGLTTELQRRLKDGENVIEGKKYSPKKSPHQDLQNETFDVNKNQVKVTIIYPKDGTSPVDLHAVHTDTGAIIDIKNAPSLEDAINQMSELVKASEISTKGIEEFIPEEFDIDELLAQDLKEREEEEKEKSAGDESEVPSADDVSVESSTEEVTNDASIPSFEKFNLVQDKDGNQYSVVSVSDDKLELHPITNANGLNIINREETVSFDKKSVELIENDNKDIVNDENFAVKSIVETKDGQSFVVGGNEGSAIIAFPIINVNGKDVINYDEAVCMPTTEIVSVSPENPELTPYNPNEVPEETEINTQEVSNIPAAVPIETVSIETQSDPMIDYDVIDFVKTPMSTTPVTPVVGDIVANDKGANFMLTKIDEKTNTALLKPVTLNPSLGMYTTSQLEGTAPKKVTLDQLDNYSTVVSSNAFKPKKDDYVITEDGRKGQMTSRISCRFEDGTESNLGTNHIYRPDPEAISKQSNKEISDFAEAANAPTQDNNIYLNDQYKDDNASNPEHGIETKSFEIGGD